MELIALTIVFLLGGLVGALFYREFLAAEVVAVHEGSAPPISMADDSEVLTRDPSAKLDTPAPIRPPQHTVVRTAEVTVKPPAVQLPERRVGDVICPAERIECPPVDVRFDLLRGPDGGYRVQVSAPDAEILGGVDVPREPVYALRKRPNSVTLLGGEDLRGAVYLREHGRLAFGGGAVQVDDLKVLPVAALRLSW